MAEVEILGNTYLIGKLSARQQFHIAKRLAKTVKSLGELAPIFEKIASRPVTITEGDTGALVPTIDNTDILAAVGTLADAITSMSDEDTDFILDQCLRVVSRREGLNGTVRYQPIVNPSGGVQYQDVEDLGLQLRLCVEVLRANLGNFSLAPLLDLLPQRATMTAAPSL